MMLPTPISCDCINRVSQSKCYLLCLK
uniref:Uncharacterized protein n=1 Tax=Anguilla anguilla TaxID=7936 RepID=A0A0E9PW23_ANGAN